jgi:hypothetical protein
MRLEPVAVLPTVAGPAAMEPARALAGGTTRPARRGTRNAANCDAASRVQHTPAPWTTGNSPSFASGDDGWNSTGSRPSSEQPAVHSIWRPPRSSGCDRSSLLRRPVTRRLVRRRRRGDGGGRSGWRRRRQTRRKPNRSHDFLSGSSSAQRLSWTNGITDGRDNRGRLPRPSSTFRRRPGHGRRTFPDAGQILRGTRRPSAPNGAGHARVRPPRGAFRGPAAER